MKKLQCLLICLALTNSVFATPSVPGYTISCYAHIDEPQRLSFNQSGDLFVGNGVNYLYVRIYRIPKGGGTAEFYGPELWDPDALVVDSAGQVSGTPGSVLVGGNTIQNVQATVWAIAPDQSFFTLANSTSFKNPDVMRFDNTGRLLLADSPETKGVYDYNTESGHFELLFVDSAGVVSMDISSTNEIFVSGADGKIRKYSSDGNLIDANFADLGENLPYYCQLAFGKGGLWGNDLYAIANGNLIRFDTLGNQTVIGTGFGTMINDMIFGLDTALYVSDLSGSQILQIPEPATFLLLGLGSLAFLRKRKV